MQSLSRYTDELKNKFGEGLQVNKNQDEYTDAVSAANLKLQRARRASEQVQDNADTEEQVGNIHTDSSLKLRLLGAGKTAQNAGATTAQEYQIRVQAAAEEYAITGDLKALRGEISTPWADKMVPPLKTRKQPSKSRRPTALR